MTTQPRGEERAVEAPVTVGGYTLLTKIGEGGMGVVHLARAADGRRVALKLLRPHIVGDDEARRRLAREVSSLERVRSRWVAEIIDADPWAAVPFVATRYVPGLSLHDHVHSEGRIEGADLTWFAGCLAEGLASVHGVGVLHRDVKPSNVLMEGRTPILIDFGLARVADDPKLTHTGWLLGTPGYLAPEILYGDDATAASDVHSWAATVAFAGLGRAPFGRGPSMAIMDRVRRGEHDLRGLEGPLGDVVASCLDPEPGRRPTLASILAWLRPQTTQPQPLLVAPPTVPRRVEQPVEQPVDPYTLPLAIAASAHDAIPTTLDPTRVEPVEPVPPVAPAWPAATPPPATVLQPPAFQPLAPDPWPGAWPQPAPERVPLGERLRRLTLVASAVVAGAALITLAPWVLLAVLALLTWLLRSASLATEDVGQRRRVRGRKWYDGLLLLAHAPWRVVQALPGTLVLLAWSIGLAAAAALVCYAVAATVTVGLFVSGLVLVGALWWGPGAGRVRSPLARVVHPASRTPGWWMLAAGGFLVAALVAGLLVHTHGVVWAPGTHRPFAQHHR